MAEIVIDNRARKYILDSKNDAVTVKLERYGGG